MLGIHGETSLATTARRNLQRAPSPFGSSRYLFGTLWCPGIHQLRKEEKLATLLRGSGARIPVPLPIPSSMANKGQPQNTSPAASSGGASGGGITPEAVEAMFKQLGNQIDELTKHAVKTDEELAHLNKACLLYTSPSPRDLSTSRMPSSA